MTIHDMAEKWLQVVRNDIAATEAKLAQLKRHEQECVDALRPIPKGDK